MASPAVESSFDVAFWFIDRAFRDNEYLQPQKLHRLMFLAQAYYAVAYHGRPLMPALFVADAAGPIEPNVYRACAVRRPEIETRPLPSDVNHFLDSIWRRFGQHGADYLTASIAGHPPYQQALKQGPRSIISIASMIAFYGKKPSTEVGAPPVQQVLRPRVMRSQEGKPVSVRKWMPKSKTPAE